VTPKTARKLLDEALEKKHAAEDQYKHTCQRIISESSKDNLESLGSMVRSCISEGAYDPLPEERDWPVTHIVFDEADTIRKPLFHKAGVWVSIRLVDDEYKGKTFLGVLIGEIARPLLRYSKETKILSVSSGAGNPAIWVPDLNRVVMGYESWWREVKSPEDLKVITDTDIDNIWYVKALKDMIA